MILPGEPVEADLANHDSPDRHHPARPRCDVARGGDVRGAGGPHRLRRLRDTDRTQADIWSIAPDGVTCTSSPTRQGLRHLPGLLGRRQAHRLLQQPHRRLRDLGDGRERQARAASHRARDLVDLSRTSRPTESLLAFSGTGRWWLHGPVDRAVRREARRPTSPIPRTCGGVPVWSPDGTTILFVRIAGDFSSCQLWTRDVATGLRTQLTFDPTFKDQTPDWSPDGHVSPTDADDDIWMMDADGSDQDNLTNTADVEFGTAFSPDGTHIAFTVTVGPCRPETLRPDDPVDGSDRHFVTATPGLLHAVPAWQPLGAGR